MSEYFKESNFPVHPIHTKEKDGTKYHIDIMKNIEENLKTSKDIKNVFDNVFYKNENTFYDLRSPVSYDTSLNKKIINIVEKETGLNLINDASKFIENEKLNDYKKFYVYLKDLKEDLPEIVKDDFNNIRKEEKDESLKEKVEGLKAVSRFFDQT